MQNNNKGKQVWLYGSAGVTGECVAHSRNDWNPHSGDNNPKQTEKIPAKKKWKRQLQTVLTPTNIRQADTTTALRTDDAAWSLSGRVNWTRRQRRGAVRRASQLDWLINGVCVLGCRVVFVFVAVSPTKHRHFLATMYWLNYYFFSGFGRVFFTLYACNHHHLTCVTLVSPVRRGRRRSLTFR